jgi:hypothetical protein
MDKFVPGFSRLPVKLRRAMGFGLLAVFTLGITMPIVIFASMGPACGGGYPERWCKAPLDSVVDNWGMYNRECVSYTAWKVASTGRNIPAGLGDANNWPSRAKAFGVATDGHPRAGDVAIQYDSGHGHSMYVEAVNGDGTLQISQYNASKTGTFSRGIIRPDGLVFVHF